MFTLFKSLYFRKFRYITYKNTRSKLFKINYKKLAYFMGGCMWLYLGTFDQKYVKKKCYDKGLEVSQKFKLFPVWDGYVEPFIIRQFAVLFTAGNSFIKGMISDNVDHVNVDIAIEELKNEVKVELFENNE